MTPQYVAWYSIRHQDSRRASGVGYNKSLVHILGYKDRFHSLCGREIFISRTPKEEEIGSRMCTRCLAKWTLVMKVYEQARAVPVRELPKRFNIKPSEMILILKYLKSRSGSYKSPPGFTAIPQVTASA